KHVGFSQNGRWLITCGGLTDSSIADGVAPGFADLWDTNDFRPRIGVATLRPRGRFVHEAPVQDSALNGAVNRQTDHFIALAENGKAVVCTIDQTGRIVRTGRPLEHPLNVGWADFSLNGRHVVTACRDRTARVWDVETDALAFPPLFHTGTV